MSLSCAAIGFGGVLAAEAADIPPPPPLPDLRPAIHDWSGPYVGGMVGVGFLDTDYTPTPGPDPELSGGGFVGGGFVGYNMQFGHVVAGVEGDFAFTEIGASNTLDAVQFDIPWVATVRGRVGLAGDRVLYYVTGGLGIAEGKMHLPAFGETESAVHLGYVLGGGIEHAVLDSLSIRLEYLYGDFEEKRYDFTAGVVDLPLNNLHMVRAGVAWHFMSGL